MSDGPAPITEVQPPVDPRPAFVGLLKDHINACPSVRNLARVLVSDGFSGFWLAPFSHTSGNWDGKGGLAAATSQGYKALRVLSQTAKTLMTDHDENRLVALYLAIMSARWASIKTGRITFERSNPCAVTSVAISNSMAAGMDLSPAEAQAITRWFSSRREMLADHEGFTAEWWVIAETMSWLFNANKR